MALNTKKRVVWIDSIKFLACVMLFWRHYFEALWNDTEAGRQLVVPAVQTVLKACGGILNGNYWICVFCLISGVFACRKRISSFLGLVETVLSRYLRFALSFLASAVIAWILSVTVGMRTQTTAPYLGEAWFQMFYLKSITLVDILRCGFLFEPAVNAPLWMIMDLFKANIAIYCITYLAGLFKKINIRPVFFAVACLIAICTNHLYFASGMVGALLLPLVQKQQEEGYKTKVWISVIFVAFFLLCYFDFFDDVVHAFERFYDYRSGKDALNAFATFMMVLYCAPIQKILSLKVLERWDYLSFPVYLIHWPVTCSISLALFEPLLRRTSYTADMMIVFVITNIICFLMCWAYAETIDKYINTLIGKGKLLLKKQ